MTRLPAGVDRLGWVSDVKTESVMGCAYELIIGRLAGGRRYRCKSRAMVISKLLPPLVPEHILRPGEE